MSERADRTHFVYEAYDDDGLLLYVGCTGNPGGRYKAHMTGDGDGRGWFHPFVTHWRVSGPYPRVTAFAIERERIQQCQPIWNGTSRENAKGRRDLIAAYLRHHGVKFVRNPYRNRPDLVQVRKTRRLSVVRRSA